MDCDERLQPFGFLVWAACGKDPGYTPRSLLAAADAICGALPAGEAGKCIATPQGELFRGTASDVTRALNDQAVFLHEGRLKGSWPRVVR